MGGGAHKIWNVAATGNITRIETKGEFWIEAIGLTVDDAGNLYFSDPAISAILKMTPAGVTNIVIENSGRDFDPIWKPRGLAIDRGGNLYVADQFNHRVRKITDRGVITTVAGTARQSGFSGDGGLATNARLDSPSDVAVSRLSWKWRTAFRR